MGSGGGFLRRTNENSPSRFGDHSLRQTESARTSSSRLWPSLPPGVSVVQARAEDLGRDPNHRERDGLVLARAIAPLRLLLKLTLPFARVGGALALPKGSSFRREIEEAFTALDLLGGKVEQTAPMEVYGPGPKPTLIIVRKMFATPDKFPRRAGIPASARCGLLCARPGPITFVCYNSGNGNEQTRAGLASGLAPPSASKRSSAGYSGSCGSDLNSSTTSAMMHAFDRGIAADRPRCQLDGGSGSWTWAIQHDEFQGLDTAEVFVKTVLAATSSRLQSGSSPGSTCRVGCWPALLWSSRISRT